MTVLRTIYSLLFFLLSTLLVAKPLTTFYMVTERDVEKMRTKVHRLLWNYARTVTLWHGIPGVRFSVGNPRGEDFNKPAVIICNHQSHLDLMTMLMLTPKLVVLTKDWVWNNPLYGNIIRAAEYYPISEGIEALLPKLRSLIDRGYSIAVYPEGTRSPDCTISRFHQGAFYLAKELDVDVLPIVSYGAGRALPKKGKYLRKWPMRIEIDERLSPSKMEAFGASPKEQAANMRERYRQRYAEIANRMEQDV